MNKYFNYFIKLHLYYLLTMNDRFQFVSLNYLEEISGGDLDFKKELITIFLHQIPEFIMNMHRYFSGQDYEKLAKEAHTAKSSVLIFMMNETGLILKNIQLKAEANEPDTILQLIDEVECSLENAYKELSAYQGELEELSSVK
jgi:HPt (histidine-containing phosphotransfer) domain-containing protein